MVKELHIHFCWIVIVEFGDENPRNCGKFCLILIWFEVWELLRHRTGFVWNRFVLLFYYVVVVFVSSFVWCFFEEANVVKFIYVYVFFFTKPRQNLIPFELKLITNIVCLCCSNETRNYYSVDVFTNLPPSCWRKCVLSSYHLCLYAC